MNKFEKGKGMPNSPVLELQALAEDPQSNILRLLLKAKVISSKLNLEEVTTWVDMEINGYPTQGDTPSYRRVLLPLKAYNPYRGWIDVDLGTDDPELQEHFGTACFTESISSIEKHSLSTETLHLTVPPAMAEVLYDASSNSRMKLAWMVSNGCMVSILTAVRFRILNWTLELEAQGVLGEGLFFSSKEIEVAPMTVHNITNIHGNVNNAGVIGSGNGDITQNNSITAGDFNSLEKQLKEWGVSDEDVRTLHQAVQESPAPTSADNFGSRIGEWIGNTIGKAYAGTLRIAGSAAPVLLTNAICHYYGIPV
ncbi:abortive phage resistance protein [Enterobacter asburiae]|uniref:AbiTii domain-containing protein n=1 Tax=Enterobacteriaceae TaxID=543 RepID=UPI0019A89013|nr:MULTISPECIES: abortive phage resistance protein [unclassified Citrobacter]EFU3942512.1 abortive phage resistance protein [Escherichia coli]MDM3403576.1 abortive phage resistance protein [Citrobacter sp. Cb019]MDM3427240.1 abortive phage resistance protein [Citrobacter sp. Cb026]WQJ92054.1 abortive phage resistance protein [Enterobacter hormaechei]